MELQASTITYKLGEEELMLLLSRELNVPLGCIRLDFVQGTVGSGNIMDDDRYETVGLTITVDNIKKADIEREINDWQTVPLPGGTKDSRQRILGPVEGPPHPMGWHT